MSHPIDSARPRQPITLAMVSYRKASVLPLVIESAASGSLVPDLVVVADDGSDDGTPDAAGAGALHSDARTLVTRG